MTQIDLNTLTKEQLINLLYEIHCEARDFYAQYDNPDDPWVHECNQQEKADIAHNKLMKIMDWADGIGIEDKLESRSYEEF